MLQSIASIASNAADDNGYSKALCAKLAERFCQSALTHFSLAQTSRTPSEDTADSTLMDFANKVQQRALESNQPIALSSRPVSETDDRQLAVAPLGVTPGFIAVLFEPLSVADRLARLQELRLIAEIAGGHFLKPAATTPESTSLHQSLELQDTTYSIANELRRHAGCDRVSVFVREGSRLKLHAVSGQAAINHRANVMQSMSKLVNCVGWFAEPFFHPSTEAVAPEVEKTLTDYVDVSDTTALNVQTLLRPVDTPPDAQVPPSPTHADVIGAVVLESFRGGTTSITRPQTPFIHAVELALNNALTHNQIFLLPLWKRLGRWMGANARGKLIIAATLAIVAALALTFVKTEYHLHANGTLQPTQQHHLFAPMDGIVKELRIEHGSMLNEQDVVLELENAELEQQIDRVLGELNVVQRRLLATTAMRMQRPSRQRPGDAARPSEQIASDQQQLESELEHLTEQLQLLRSRHAKLTVRTPAAGKIVTWEVQDQLRARPVNRGQLLVTVAVVDGPWQLQLDLPEKHTQRLQKAFATSQSLESPLLVDFVTGTAPDEFHFAHVTHVADSAQPHETLGVAIRVHAAVPDDANIARHTGADVRAKIRCGQRPLGFVLFNNVVEFVRLRVLFYFR